MVRPYGGRVRIRRFTRSELAAHWVLALSVLTMIATGLALGINIFHSAVFPVHVGSVFVLAAGLVLIAATGNRRALAASARDLRNLDGDDRRWLRGRRVRQGRFNAGQKINAILTAAFALLFLVSGFFLWLGERNHRFRLDGAVAVHDAAMYASLVLLVGHLYLAVLHPATRHALRGMTHGDVREDWAELHHGKWVAAMREDATEPTR